MTPINMLCFISDKVYLTPLCISNFSQRERERERMRMVSSSSGLPRARSAAATWREQESDERLRRMREENATVFLHCRPQFLSLSSIPVTLHDPRSYQSSTNPPLERRSPLMDALPLYHRPSLTHTLHQCINRSEKNVSCTYKIATAEARR